MRTRIALVGNAPENKHELLNTLLADDTLTEMYDVSLYGADGQPEADSLQDAIDDWHDGIIDGIACLPLREGLPEGMPIKIHATSRLAYVSKTRDITQESIVKRATALAKALKRDLSILNPRIAILSLNSEIATGDDSAEINIIAPAVSELVKKRIQAFGPIANGKFFDTDDFMAFDAVLQMREGQCDEAFANVSNENFVTMFAEAEPAITMAEPEELLKALNLSADIARNRKVYDQPFDNPLPKLYHEKREDGDKARFAVKKGFNPAEHRRENVTYIKEKNIKDTNS